MSVATKRPSQGSNINVCICSQVYPSMLNKSTAFWRISSLLENYPLSLLFHELRALHMAAAAVDTVGGVLGLTTDGLGIISRLKDTLFPGPSPASMNNFRVFVGLTRNKNGPNNDPDADSRSLGGAAPALAAWDAAGGFLHQVTPDGPSVPRIAGGGFRDYAIEGRQGADYLSVVQNGNDGICIHLITGRSAGTGTQFMWTGDIGKTCGAPWYGQRNPITNDENKYFPSCIWIDGNADSDHTWTGFNMHLGSFIGSNTESEDTVASMNQAADAFQKDNDLLCKSEPRFSMYEDVHIGNQIRIFFEDPSVGGPPNSTGYADKVLGRDNWGWGDKPPSGLLPHNPLGKGPRIACIEDECPPKGPSFNQSLPRQPETRRSLGSRFHRQPTADVKHIVLAEIKKRQVLHADNLVISKIDQHSAVELCNSPYSLGPDMVSWTEMMFCDMSEKQLWPVCTESTTSYCFDMITQTAVESNSLSSTINSTSVSEMSVKLVAGGPSRGRVAIPSKS